LPVAEDEVATVIVTVDVATVEATGPVEVPLVTAAVAGTRIAATPPERTHPVLVLLK
jgi:hypothetical protein